MNRLLDRHIAHAQQELAEAIDIERATLLVMLSEAASGTRRVETSRHATSATRVAHWMVSYNALVALRTELGE